MRNEIIHEWFESWKNPLWVKFDKVFDSQIYYSESHGPEYQGIIEIEKWFQAWHLKFKLIHWNIIKVIHIGAVSFVEWDFSCEYKGKIDCFLGISKITWSTENKILSLYEYASTLPKV